MKVGGDQDWFICPCGNEPHKDGFFSCTKEGSVTSPTLEGDWEGILYVCGFCNSIINSHSMEIVGKCSDQIIHDNNRFNWSSY